MYTIKRAAFALTLCALTASAVRARVLGETVRSDIGVGVRALGMGGVFTALADDPSGLYWNPAGMATAASGAFVLGLDGIRPAVEAGTRDGFEDRLTRTENQRVHLNTASALWVRNRYGLGRAFGIGYQSPYALDAVLDYRGTYLSDSGATDYRNQYLATGTLDFWTIGGGIEVVRGLSVGAAFSAVTGAEFAELRYYEQSGAGDELLYHDLLRRRYFGYDARIGFTARGPGGFLAGGRVVFPSRISFCEFGEMRGSVGDGDYGAYELTGSLRSYFEGALGAAMSLPVAAISGEVRGRSPRPRRRLDDPRERWKTGAGVGAEAYLMDSALVVRGGYSWSRYDRTPYEVRYDDPVLIESAHGEKSPSGEHQVSIGLGFRPAKRVSVDCAVSETYYSLVTAGELHEDHHMQRITGSFHFSF